VQLVVEHVGDLGGLTVTSCSSGSSRRKSILASLRSGPERIALALGDVSPVGFGQLDVADGRADGLTPQTYALVALALLTAQTGTLEVASSAGGRVARIEGREIAVEIVELSLL
jgi:hypothetical protein